MMEATASQQQQQRALSPHESSMTLSVTPTDAKRITEASRALNERLRQLRTPTTSTDTNNLQVAPTFSADSGDSHVSETTNSSSDPAVPKRVVSSSDHGSVASEDGTVVDANSLRPVIIEAACSCGNPLIETFVRDLQAQNAPAHEIQTSLLLFVQTSKTGKLRAAFQALHESTQSSSEESTIQYQGAVLLFKSFLTAIASCLQFEDEESAEASLEPPTKALKETDQSSPNSVVGEQQAATEPNPANNDAEKDVDMPRASPSFDSSMESKDSEAGGGAGGSRTILTEATRNEINEIATFASDLLFEHVQKATSAENIDTTIVSYELFHKWYGSGGGMEVVPWLDLLDLNKWESAGKPAATVGSSGGPQLSMIPEETKLDVNIEASPKNMPAPAPHSGLTPLNAFSTDNRPPAEQSPGARVLISFDFTGAMPTATSDPSFYCIDITDENLVVLRNFVHRTGLSMRPPHEVASVLLRRHAMPRKQDGALMLDREAFALCYNEMLPTAAQGISDVEMEQFAAHMRNFYSCFDAGSGVFAKELAVAFSFLCAGNKSVKLSFGFDLMDERKTGYLTQHQLKQYLRSYLTMLVGISLLSSKSAVNLSGLSDERRRGIVAAVEKGADWTLGHFLRHIASLPHINPDAIAFETFAGWYTGGGFNVAPWLELLDLAKLLGLLDDSERRKRQATLPSHLPQVFPSPRTRVEPPALPAAVDILFTFPLANRRSLVVLREDAVYVREVVEKLGLVSTTPDDVWTSLFASAKKKPDLPVKASEKPRQRKPGTGKSMDVDQATFVECMESIVEAALNGRKRPLKGKAKTSKSVKETLENFFQSFDLEQIDRVSLNQLMGGLSLLCDGKKSSKLAFGFGLFDNSSPTATKAKKKKSDMPSLSGEELFLFLRSFLIVTFSCCRQSMDLTAEAVGRYISDTAHMVAEDVMRYQWQSCKQDRVNFDEFGEWYNEGGFETAPWLELLDLKKWVLVDDLDSIQQHRASAMPQRSPRTGGLSDFDCPPAPPDDAMDPSFFADDDHPIMPMDSIDEMDLMLLQQPSQDKENDRLLRTNKTFNTLLASPRSPKRPPPQAPPPRPPPQPQSSLKFHLVTNDKHSGYMLSVSPRRVSHLRHILIDSGLCQVDAEDAAREIMRKASAPKDSKMNGDNNNNRLTMDKDAFDSAIRSILTLTQGKGTLNPTTQRVLFDLLSSVFHAFERTQPGNPNAREIACGLTILCRGKKSDKLEFAFEMLDETGSGQMTRHQVGRYLSSFLSALLSVATASCLESDGIGEDSLTLMNGDRCDRSMLGPAVDAGSEWATNQAFQSRFKTKGPNDALTFDDFADWYTTEGFSSIPWLELLDLRKWVLTSS